MPKGIESSTEQERAVSTRDFKIVAETDDYVVVEKPPFLLVHPTKPGGPPTLWSELRNLLAFEIANGGKVSIVNRLDRETSGLTLIAKTSATARRFGRLMQEQRIEKEYLAIVFGWPEWEQKIVDAPLARAGECTPSPIWLKQAIHPQGAPALTEFVIEERFIRSTTAGDRFSLIRAFPRTGRTHQIRVHLSSSAIKFMDRTNKTISASSRTAGRRNSSARCSFPAMRCMLHRSQLTMSARGEARCQPIWGAGWAGAALKDDKERLPCISRMNR